MNRVRRRTAIIRRNRRASGVPAWRIRMAVRRAAMARRAKARCVENDAHTTLAKASNAVSAVPSSLGIRTSRARASLVVGASATRAEARNAVASRHIETNGVRLLPTASSGGSAAHTNPAKPMTGLRVNPAGEAVDMKAAARGKLTKPGKNA